MLLHVLPVYTLLILCNLCIPVNEAFSPAFCQSVELITIKNSPFLVNLRPISFFFQNPLIEFDYE